MKFIKTDSPEPAAKHIAEVILGHLAPNQHLLWLVSGGSAIDVAVRARQKLPEKIDNLLVMQVDERYGPVGHKDGNWQQLLDAGFNKSGIKYSPVLKGQDLATTVREYKKEISSSFAHSGFLVGLFGIGADGHTAGILPNSLAAGSPDLVSSYQGPDFERITITPAAIAKLDLAIVYVMGESKTTALENLNKQLTISQQPAQALKAVREVYIYSDYEG